MARAEYHVHTSASYDSRASPAELVERALAAGLDVVFVTDHDTIDGAVAVQAAAGRRLRVVVGCEFTCDDGSHVIGLGLRDFIAERRVPAVLERLKAQGATIVLPHLFRRGSGIFRDELRRDQDFVRMALSYADAVECFNARDGWEKNQRSQRFALERGLPVVAGSDAHAARELGRVFVEYDEEPFAESLSARRIYFPSQRAVAEAPSRRRAMELVHGSLRRFPALDRSYRALRSRLGRDRPRWANAAPCMQHDLPRATPRAAPREG
ncbi:PHP domain-containing protein [Anaeromyxobacter sp. Fw109-5]|uniref:PHP domain-containing protein n=1 Tax=Anaeromyxobacter sp. (strain Fw109-5) TaxID=404589 RepID=UPI000158A623|nr:PHP domain-containing protein [Anaeromyxobacter sp. Fw109-5]ABS26822.1 PHP domain protein [Anaeromyxobacter sp. Fw109-5]